MNRIAEIRKEKGIPQKKLSEFLGISPGNLCEWEKGRIEPNIDYLIKLANYFECSVDYLVGREDDFGNVNVAGQLTDQLTADERELLSCFNATDFAGREALLISARALAGKKEKIKG